MADLTLSTQIEYIKTIDLNLGYSSLIVGTSDSGIPDYDVYTPTDRNDCQDQYGDSPISYAYWEAVSQGAGQLSCVSIPDITSSSLEKLFGVLDNYSFDILMFPELGNDNKEALNVIDTNLNTFKLFGNGFITVLAPPQRSMRTIADYYQLALTNQSYVNNPQYFFIPIGDITYNIDSKFQYTTNAVGTVGGLLGNLPLGKNPSYKSFVGSVLDNEWTLPQIQSLMSCGYAPVIDSISKGRCLYKGVTIEGNTYTHIGHARIANVVNKALRLVLNKYIGNALFLGNVKTEIDNVLAYYQGKGTYRSASYNLTQTNRNELVVELSIIPSDTIYKFNTNLKVVIAQ